MDLAKHDWYSFMKPLHQCMQISCQYLSTFADDHGMDKCQQGVTVDHCKVHLHQAQLTMIIILSWKLTYGLVSIIILHQFQLLVNLQLTVA